MLSTIQSDFYGDNVRWFIGIVEDIADPLRLGRARVRVFGIHNPKVDEIATADLPWSQPIVPTTEGGISGVGSNPKLLVGLQVIGFFLDGRQSQIPVIIGSLPHIETPISGNLGAQYRASDAVINEVSRNQQNATNNAGSISGGGTNTRGNFVDTSGAVGSDNVEKAFNFFVSTNLFTPEQSAGICGNLIQESNMNPTIESGFAGEGSVGIAQWNPGQAAGNRLGQLKDFSNSRNLDWGSLETQLQFIVYELETVSYLGMAQLQSARSIAEAATVFSNKYERPAPAHARIYQRISYAQGVYESYYHSQV